MCSSFSLNPSALAGRGAERRGKGAHLVQVASWLLQMVLGVGALAAAGLWMLHAREPVQLMATRTNRPVDMMSGTL